MSSSAQQQGMPSQALLEAALEPTPGLLAGAAVNSGVFLLGIRVLLAGDRQLSFAKLGLRAVVASAPLVPVLPYGFQAKQLLGRKISTLLCCCSQ